MELDELKQAWQSLERKLDRQHALELHHFRTGRLHSARTGLRPLVAGLSVQAGVGVAVMAIFGPYWVGRWGEWHLVAYGLALHLYGLMLTVFGGRDLVTIARIDYAAPVLEIQKQIAQLRADRIQAAPAFAIAGCFVWVPLVLVLFEWVGADLWVHKPAMVAWFLGSGLCAVAVTAAVIAWGRRPGSTRTRRYLEESAVGRSVMRTQAVLEEIRQFERD
jgi:hypothetical protein